MVTHPIGEEIVMPKSSRMRASWGSVSYDAKRKVGRIRYWAETPDGYRRCSKTVRGTRKDVEEARAHLMLEHGEDAPCPTVRQVWERWVRPDYVRRLESRDISKRTLAQSDSTWKVHVSPRWGDLPCDEVRVLDFQQWILDGMTLMQAKASVSLMKIILDWPMRYEFIQSNVLRTRLTMPSKTTVNKHDKGVWNLEQLGELWKHVHGSFIEPAFILSAFGSCRVGESLGPLADEVSVVEGHPVPVVTVPIVRQVESRGGVTDILKTSQSRRTVVVVGRAAEVLARLAKDASGTWLTNNGCNEFVRQSHLRKTWARLVPNEMRHPFTNLRNSWQTNMRWEVGLPQWAIEPLMGHVSQGVTGMYYDRPRVEMFVQQVVSAYAKRPYDAGWTWLDEG